jgi:nucleoside-diphosphate-sugar epimerase
MARRILVTGASGFIGSAIVRHLALSGEAPVALHSRATALSPGLDILSASIDDTAHLVADLGITDAIHAAWYTGHSDYLHADVNRDWLDASIRFAKGFTLGGGSRLVALGTCVEYGMRSGSGRFVEGVSPIAPDTLYGECKAALASALGALGLNHAWARLFFVYGPGDREGRMLPYLIDSLSCGNPVVAKEGGVWRDYIHVDDLAMQLVALLDSAAQGPTNTGTGAAVRIGAVFEMAGALLGRPDLVTTNDRVQLEQVLRIEADMTRYASLVGAVNTRNMSDWMKTVASGIAK